MDKDEDGGGVGDGNDDFDDKDGERPGDTLKFVKVPDNAVKLPVEKLRPVDHMDAIKMEQDGHINKDFHKEMFLGDHEEFENDRYDEAESKLKDIVYKVDSDHDGQLSVPELEAWVETKMEEHFSAATDENEDIFNILTLMAMIQLDPDSKEELIRYKFRWSDADTDPLDNELTREEFMAFRHPEQSEKTLNNMVISIMSGIDTDGDGVISEEEFTALPPGEVEGEEFQAMDKSWQKERQQEFEKIMDLDHNGKVTKDELKVV
nr:hypothetical protein BaRGS_005193 [Batillaria attramentaria]